MNEETLIDDIASLLRERGYNVEDGQGEWPIEVYSKDGSIFGISVIEIDNDR